MEEIRLSLQAVAIVGMLLTSLATALATVCAAVAYLYRQDAKGWHRTLEAYERVIQEKEARWVDAIRDVENKEIENTTLRASNERITRLATDATEGWKTQVIAERARLS